MDRVRQLTLFWNWLPAFRVVAETQHLPSAAKELNVTAPALSRSIRLLEQQLGQKLFRRVGRNIVLTDGGQRFLDHVRDGMRFIHEGVEELQEANLKGEVLILSSGLITTFLIRALAELREANPELRPVVTSESPESAPERLLRGKLDLALHDEPLDVPRLTTQFLGEATSGVYCGPGHPLYDRRQVTREMLSDYEFVGPIDGPALPDEGWPADLPRRVAMQVSHMHLGCEVCAQGRLLATLPDVVARSFSGGEVLRRLPIELTQRTRLYATHRPSLGAESRADLVIAALRRHID